jgi:alpha-D-ribose 1-methylphosphonate 5-triphosphate synthase subunit PhnG
MKRANEQDNRTTVINRKSWLSILAKSPLSEIQALWKKLELNPEWELIRKPEIGMVMVQGQTGGNGKAFNLGEMTITRAAVRLKNGNAGLSYVQGRSKKHAELCAVLDAMLQTPSSHSQIFNNLITPLKETLEELRTKRSKKAANTKVNFFTMGRGH